MRAFAAMLIGCLLMPSSPAQAMNWEGHDDWMVDMEPARILAQEAPHAAPKSLKRCWTGSAPATANPYEQIPLDHMGDCPPPAKRPKPER